VALGYGTYKAAEGIKKVVAGPSAMEEIEAAREERKQGQP
jgi:hypothetical protein